MNTTVAVEGTQTEWWHGTYIWSICPFDEGAGKQQRKNPNTIFLSSMGRVKWVLQWMMDLHGGQWNFTEGSRGGSLEYFTRCVPWRIPCRSVDNFVIPSSVEFLRGIHPWSIMEHRRVSFMGRAMKTHGELRGILVWNPLKLLQRLSATNPMVTPRFPHHNTTYRGSSWNVELNATSHAMSYIGVWGDSAFMCIYI